MVVRRTVLPVDPTYAGKVVGWEIWSATGVGDAWERYSSKTHTLTQVPTDKLLGLRLFFQRACAYDATKVKSDVCFGWDYYALEVIDAQAGTFGLWRSDNKTELAAAIQAQGAQGRSRIFDGYQLTDTGWETVRADIYDMARAAGWGA